jgi:dephospho-CoA kinase
VIGLCGGIGSGKSTVARLLESLGATVIDSDRLAHDQLNDPEVIRHIRSWWGDRVCPDGRTVDRRVIAEIVFNDPEQLARLEKLLYPRIDRERQAIMERSCRAGGVRAFVWDAAKLHEAGLDAECDAMIFVEADRTVRLDRVRRTRGWDEAEVDRRENRQKPLDRKKATADYVIRNNSDIEDLRAQTERVFWAVLNTDD